MQTLALGNRKDFYSSHGSMPLVIPMLQLEQVRSPLQCAYGKCSHYGCPCQGFVGDTGSSVCNNCGHSYSDHW